MAKKYFVDRDHKVMGEYYDFLDSEQNSPAKTEKKMMLLWIYCVSYFVQIPTIILEQEHIFWQYGSE